MPAAQMKKLGTMLVGAGLGGLAGASLGGLVGYTAPWKKEVPKDKDRSRTDNVKFPESKMPPIRQEMLEKPQEESEKK